MAPRNINTVTGSFFTSLGTHSTYAILIFLLLCILLLIQRGRNRQQRSNLEHVTSLQTSKETRFANPNLNSTFPETPQHGITITQIADPLSDVVGSIASTSFTSGFLAAKADIEQAAKAARAEQGSPTPTNETFPLSNLDIEGSSSSFEDQQIPWRRHSYPEDQNSALRKTSRLDETEYFSDPHDAGIVWRRRTMVFQDKP